MTSTLDPQTTTALTPQQRIDAWLSDFEAALAVRDIERVVGMFAVDSFWRDLVSFTWNLKTLEGRDQIADMLTARLAETDPSGFSTREEPTQDGDVVSGRILEDKADKLVVLPNPLKPEEKVTVAKADIKSTGPSKLSPMPSGLANVLTKDEVLDLIALLERGGNKNHPDFAK